MADGGKETIFVNVGLLEVLGERAECLVAALYEAHGLCVGRVIGGDEDDLREAQCADHDGAECEFGICFVV